MANSILLPAVFQQDKRVTEFEVCSQVQADILSDGKKFVSLYG